MEQNRELRNKPVRLWSITLTKRSGMYNGEKTVSSTSGVRNVGQLHAN